MSFILLQQHRSFQDVAGAQLCAASCHHGVFACGFSRMLQNSEVYQPRFAKPTRSYSTVPCALLFDRVMRQRARPHETLSLGQARIASTAYQATFDDHLHSEIQKPGASSATWWSQRNPEWNCIFIRFTLESSISGWLVVDSSSEWTVWLVWTSQAIQDSSHSLCRRWKCDSRCWHHKPVSPRARKNWEVSKGQLDLHTQTQTIPAVDKHLQTWKTPEGNNTSSNFFGGTWKRTRQYLFGQEEYRGSCAAEYQYLHALWVTKGHRHNSPPTSSKPPEGQNLLLEWKVWRSCYLGTNCSASQQASCRDIWTYQRVDINLSLKRTLHHIAFHGYSLI